MTNHDDSALIAPAIQEQLQLGAAARIELPRVREQLAAAHAAGARSATQRDEARTTAEAMAQSVKRLVRERDRLLEANKTIIGENHNVREQLDRANTERQTLAAELATKTAVAQGNARHVVMLMNVLDRIEQLTVVGDTDLTPDTTVTVAEILHALNEPFPAPLTAPPVRPGSSRRAQEEPGRIDAEWWNRRALISDTLGRALWKCGHVVPLSVRDRCAEAVLAAQDAPAPPATVTLDNSAGRFVPAALPQPRRSFWHRVLQALARR